MPTTHLVTRKHSRVRLLLAAIAAAVVLVPTAPAPAQAALTVGIGEQRSGFFTDPLFLSLNIRHVRVVVPYDLTDHRDQTAVMEQWLGPARAAGYDILVTFGRSRKKSLNDKLPSLSRYKKRVAEFMRRYPFVQNYVPWNEPNLCSSRTCHNPKAAAKMYLALRDMCPGCKVLAADMVDTANMKDWLKQFQRYTKGRPKLWGLHNYVDANAGTTTGTRRMLSAVKGEIWFTETGGIVKRWKKDEKKSRNRQTTAFKVGVKYAAKATKRVFKLARLSPRITRAYFYHWNQDPSGQWDSAFVDKRGKPRPSLDVLRAELRRTGQIATF